MVGKQVSANGDEAGWLMDHANLRLHVVSGRESIEATYNQR